MSERNVQELQEEGDVHALIRALENEDHGVRRDAVEALGKIGDARAVERLTVALKDSEAEVREAATEALAKVRGR